MQCLCGSDILPVKLYTHPNKGNLNPSMELPLDGGTSIKQKPGVRGNESYRRN